MYTVVKTMEVAGAHCLRLNYNSPCQNLHGHNWQITIYCRHEQLNENGMVVDFSKIKRIVNKLDHANLNEILGIGNPTAENIAKWICDRIKNCYKVIIRESQGNSVIYEV
jgi:6-pyruvoyltetrahydropterin/6-carboxytetrahydropterin synthase